LQKSGRAAFCSREIDSHPHFIVKKVNMLCVFRLQHFIRAAQFYAIAIFVMGKTKHPRMMAHDNFLFFFSLRKWKGEKGAHGDMTLSQRRGGR
jgi:hypothetical protein